jgi:hypothetical protein
MQEDVRIHAVEDWRPRGGTRRKCKKKFRKGVKSEEEGCSSWDLREQHSQFTSWSQIC